MKNEIDRFIAQMAAEEGITKEEVLQQMQAAIDAGYYSTDPAVRAQWAAMPFKHKPTPQEFIAHMVGLVSGHMEMH